MDSVFCGVDIGGTKLGLGIVSTEGRLLAEETIHDHVRKSPDQVVADIATLVPDLLARVGLSMTALKGVGVGTAGHLRYRDGVMITMSNLAGWAGFPLRDRLQARFSVPVEVDNDANAQAFGEFTHGAGRGYRDQVFMTISTQIGAGIILGGKLFRGMTGTAGEIGHTIVDPGGDETCPCGNRGCLISVASGVALAGAFRRVFRAGAVSRLVSEADLGPGNIDGALVARGLAEGDEACIRVVADQASWIGIAVYNMFQIFNPEAVVLGGGLTNWGAPLFDGIRRKVKELARGMMYDEMPILPATLSASGIVGAASLLLSA
ncbi:MAG TPA: ROK family protein [Rectinemataceae bacterium]|nr:ROK family protein [Rectinemataceae bacterium]